MNIFKSITVSLNIILGLSTTSTFSMKRTTPAPSAQETAASTTPETGSAPALKQTCGAFRDPHAKKEKATDAPQLPMAQDDDEEEDATMADEQDDEVIAALTKEFAAAGLFQSTRFRFLNRVAEAVAIRTAMNIVRTAIKDLNKTLSEVKLDFPDESTTL